MEIKFLSYWGPGDLKCNGNVVPVPAKRVSLSCPFFYQDLYHAIEKEWTIQMKSNASPAGRRGYRRWRCRQNCEQDAILGIGVHLIGAVCFSCYANGLHTRVISMSSKFVQLELWDLDRFLARHTQNTRARPTISRYRLPRVVRERPLDLSAQIAK